jgi:acyl-CoA thioesterase-2
VSDDGLVDELLDELLQLLDLEDIELDIFRGRNESTRQGRLFGGQVAAQALVAAGRTTGGMPAHSLHGYFLRPGDPTVPVLYSVDRIRDGRSFTTRRVVALQRGKAIFNTSISFHEPERSYEHQVAMPEAPAPETVPTWQQRVREMIDRIPEEARNWAPRPRPIDLRHVELPTYLGGEPRHGTSLVWMRAARKLDDDTLLHQALLTYASDFSLLDNVVRPHGRKGELGPLMMASLDHAVWFHRPLRMDDWLLYVQDSPVATGARGFARGTIFTRGGMLVASVAQEGLMRPARQPEDRSQ